MDTREAVDALSADQIRDILIRIVEAVTANDPARERTPAHIASILNDWSLLDTGSEDELNASIEEPC